MWYFLDVRLFKGELLAVKVKSNFQKKNGSEEASKKKNCHNFDFSGLKRIAKVTHRVDYTCYSFQTRKLKIVAVLFFYASYFWWRTRNFKSVDFEQLPLKSSHDPKVPHFRKPRDLSFLMVLSWKNFPIKKYRGEGFFAIFHVHSEKNFKWLPIGQFWS